MKKNNVTVQEVAEFLRNAAYADNLKHGIDWSMRVLHPRTDWNAVSFACGIWHKKQNELSPNVSVSFTFDEVRGFYHFCIWIDGGKHEQSFGETPTFDELKETIIKKFGLKKLFHEE